VGEEGGDGPTERGCKVGGRRNGFDPADLHLGRVVIGRSGEVRTRGVGGDEEGEEEEDVEWKSSTLLLLGLGVTGVPMGAGGGERQGDGEAGTGEAAAIFAEAFHPEENQFEEDDASALNAVAVEGEGGEEGDDDSWTREKLPNQETTVTAVLVLVLVLVER